ncbi:MAG TPA: hypothetical protein VJP79_06170, partial [Nitrososphaera sp.]|nr:hypothetical protein [Nitrososphaera sp.]
SLPLAPGQKKQIAVLDWERRESAANSQFLGYEEALNNTLVHDRDINEVVSGTLTENLRSNSRASTGGIGFGLGGSLMGIIPGVGSFGSLLGISGGTSSSGSNASQSSNRTSTANSLQSIRDRTAQAASVVRSQRATVVQTVSQGERVQATAESVANYNHCHAITIQYFEVLRHFMVRNRLSGVQECLFVPLQMTPFDLEKCLRWRNTLEKFLLRPELRGAFDAVARIQHEKESPFENYYDSIGFPRKNFAEQAINFYTGELFMEFFFFNTKEDKIDDAIIAFYTLFGISLDDFRDKKITDEELAEHVGPRAIEYLLDAFTVETDKGVDLKLDLTLTSTFRQSALLRVTLRQAAGTPVSIRRDQIDGINIKLDLTKLSQQEADNLKQFQNKYMKIRVRSGNLRFRTDNISGHLFNERLDNDIFAGGDGVFVRTPLTKEELRNPRGEDVDAANKLVHHLNENFEYYNKSIFFDMTPERRFMLLDGILAPGKANGRSVASVVENRIIGIAGNSLIMPVAPGYQLDPTIDETFDMFAQYYHEEQEAMRVSMPTKGIYAEAVIGECNSCEEKDEGRFWRWEESPIPDSPNTQILPLNTDTRRADPGNLQPKDFPAPVVNIQNAPAVPDPTALKDLMQIIGKADAFRDITGLNQNQLNALATFQKSLDTAQAFGKEAAELAKSAAMVDLTKEALKNGTLSKEDAKAILKKTLDPEEQAKTKKEGEENERKDTKKDVDSIDEEKQKGRLDDEQAKDMTEDRIRKGQGTTKPEPKPAPKKGKKKYNLVIMLKNYEGRPLVGTWELTYGSLVNEGFEITGADTSVKEFVVELDRSKENILQLKGNPYLTGTSTFGDPDNYFHYVDVPTVVGDNTNLTFEIFQTRVERTIEEAEGTSETKVKEHAVARELSIESSPQAEIDLLVVKFGGSISITGSRTTTDSESSESGTTETRTETFTYKVPTRRLKVKQKGVAVDELDLEE